ncbi:MAG: DUF5011 domain-containing protein [Psychromonas sp.]
MKRIKSFKLANAALAAALALALTGCGDESTTTSDSDSDSDSSGSETIAIDSITVFADALNEDWSFYDCCTSSAPEVTTDTTDGHGLVVQFTDYASETALGFSTGSLDVSGFDSASTLTFDIKVISAPTAESASTGDTGTSDWYVKLESDGGIYDADATTGAEVQFSISNLVIGTWKTVTVDFSDLGGLDLTAIDKLIISPAWGSEEGAVYNIDNVIFNAAADSTSDDDQAPIITLVGDATVYVGINDTYTDQGVTITDNVDDDLVATVTGLEDFDTSKDGSYTITYKVSDAAGNAATAVTRTVIVGDVEDTEAPVITLVGNASVSVLNGATYIDEGATVKDNVDTDLEATLTGSVNTSINGKYTLTYSAYDSAGNIADEVTRTVTVADEGVGDAVRDATEAVITISDGNNDWESWVGNDAASLQVLTDQGDDYGDVTEFSIGADAAVAGYQPDDDGSVVDVSSYSSTGTLEFDLKVTSLVTDTWYLKIESSDGSVLNDYSLLDSTNEHDAITEGEWQHFVFPLSTIAESVSLDTLNRVMIFPAWGQGDGAVYQLDNVAFYPDGADEVISPISGGGATTTVADGIDFEGEEADQLTWTSFENGDNPPLEFVTNPDKTGINSSDGVAKYTAQAGASMWAGFSTSGVGENGITLDATNCTIKMMVYKSSLSDISIKLSTSSGWAQSPVTATPSAINVWEELTFNFCGRIGATSDPLTGFTVHADILDRTTDTIVYVDNVTFSEEVVVVLDEPEVAAPTPTESSSNVLSFYSDAYAAIAGVNLYVGWGNATASEVSIDGNNTFKLENLDKQGVGFSDIDLSGKTYLHLDYWTPNATSVDVYVFGAGTETGYTVTTTTGSWVSVDIPLSSYPGANLSAAHYMKFESQSDATIYFDNIYFH